ncbi:RNAse III [Clostridium amylolyticum]|uniref:Ribonuclease 3 n=1 Tax=Clostridium amylolyticum TaxID=1121298 RepID=A0A1M6D7Y0_9CLOT|nr:ribonuclease III [Clostridium amylolyticum]SHI69293.1 RNAse III [Clostridium amylolyticum]
MNNNINSLENRLGIKFSNKPLLITAITHSSYANQYKNVQFNERLEFLGDSVLQLTITEYLFSYYKDKSEGELTKLRALIVCESSLYDVAKKLDLGSYIRMSKGEELTGGRERISLLADSMEAVLAAIYLDKGLDTVKNFITNNFIDIIEKAINNEIVLDYKTKLQEILQKQGDVNIKYDLMKYEGPPHRRKFYTAVLIENKIMGEGSGFSKKESEQSAARKALSLLEEVNV